MWELFVTSTVNYLICQNENQGRKPQLSTSRPGSDKWPAFSCRTLRFHWPWLCPDWDPRSLRTRARIPLPRSGDNQGRQDPPLGRPSPKTLIRGGWAPVLGFPARRESLPQEMDVSGVRSP